MDIEYLKRFVTVGEFLSFRKASDALFISQPALSHSISALEREIGAPVFTRNTKNVSFTCAGKILFDAAKKLINEYETALADITKLTASADGILKIGYVGAALDNTLTPLVRAFRKDEPDIDIIISRHRGTEIRELLENHTIQFAVSYYEYIEGISNIKHTVIDQQKFTVLVNSSHPLASKEEISLSDIKDEPFIICEKDASPVYYNRIMQIFDSAGFEPNIIQKVELISDIYRLVDMEKGIAIMSYSPRRQIYNNFDLSFIPIKTDNPDILRHNKTLAWCSDLTPAASKFVKKAKKLYGNQ